MIIFVIIFFLTANFLNYETVNFRVIKNAFSFLLSLLFFFFLVNLNFKNTLNYYKFYTLCISTICLLNIININLFESKNLYSYGSKDVLLSGYFFYTLTHYQDYFPYLIFSSLALDLFFFKKTKIIPQLAIIIKFIWFINFNYFSIFLGMGFINKGLMISFISFVILFFFFKYFNLKLSFKFILYSIININFAYFLILIFFYKFLDSSLQDRAESFFILFNNLNFFDFFYPVISRNEFSHNLHNDFWDLYFTFGIFFLFVYYSISKLIFIIYGINKYSAMIFYCVFIIGSLAQNNILNLYLTFNSIWIFFLIYKYSKNF